MAALTRIIGTFALCFCGFTQAHAEDNQREGALVRIGAIGGGGAVDWVGADANGGVPGTQHVAKPGLTAGVTAVLDVSRLLSLGMRPLRFAIQTDFLYSTKGAGIERDSEGRGSFYLSYFQAGLLARVEYSKSGRAIPYFLMGPTLGLLQRAELRNRFGNTGIKDDFKSTDIGIILGLGAMYALPPVGSLGLELRADLGLVSIDGQGDGDEIRNAALSLLLVYLY